MRINAEHVKKIIPVVGAVLLLIALRVFWREIRDMEVNDVKAAFADISRSLLLLSCSAVAFSYLLASLIEKHAVAESGLVMTYPKIARIAFISRAVGAAAGGLVSGASFRYRSYSRVWARPMQIARIVAATQALTWAGAGLFNSLALLLLPADITALLGVPAGLRYLLAFACAAFPAFLTLTSLAAKNKQSLTVFGRSVPVPKPKILSRQLLAGFFISPAVALSLYFLLPESHGVNFPVFCGVFALSSMVSAVSMVPAGIGVFDASLIWMLRPFYNSSELLSALLLYRLFNNLAPFAIAVMALVFDAFRPRHLAS